MTNLKEDYMEDRQGDYDDAQLDSAAQALRAARPDEDSVDPKLAHDIGFIRKETWDKIEVKVPNHMLLFQKAVAKNRETMGDFEAFKAALSRDGVYGKFILEQKSEQLQDSQSALVGVLNKVLRISIRPPKDGMTGFEGRSELVALVAELSSLKHSKESADHVAGEIAMLEQEQIDSQASLHDLEEENEVLSPVDEYFQDDTANFVTPMTGYLEKLRHDNDFTKRLSSVGPLLDRWSEVANNSEHFSEVSDDLNAAKSRLQDLQTLLSAPGTTPEQLLGQLDDMLADIIASLGASFLPAARSMENFGQFCEVTDAYNELVDARKYFSANEGMVKKHIDGVASLGTPEAQQDFEETRDQVLYAFGLQVQRLNDIHGTLDVGGKHQMIAARITRFITDLDKFAADPSAITRESLIEFIEETHIPGIEDLKQMSGQLSGNVSSEIGNLHMRLAEIGQLISVYERFDSDGGISDKLRKEAEEEKAKIEQEKVDAETELSKENGLKSDIETRISSIQRAIDKLEAASGNISDLQDLLDNGKQLQELKDKLAKLEEKLAKLKQEKATLISDNTDLEPLKDLTNDQILKKLFDGDLNHLLESASRVAIARLVLGIPDNANLSKKGKFMKSDKELEPKEKIDTAFNLASKDFILKDATKDSIGEDLKNKQLGVFKRAKQILIKAIEDDSDDRIKKDLNGVSKDQGPLRKLISLNISILNAEKEKARLEKKIAEGGSNPDIGIPAAVEKVRSFRESIFQITNILDPVEDKTLIDECNALIAKIDAVINGDPSREQILELFVQNIAEFLIRFERGLGEAKGVSDLDLANKNKLIDVIKSKIAELTARISALDKATRDPMRRFLEKHIPGVKLYDENEAKVHGFEANYKYVAAQMEKSYKYFFSPTETPNLKDNYQQLLNIFAGLTFPGGISNQIKETELDIRYLPAKPDVERTLTQMRNKHRGNAAFDEKKHRKELTAEYEPQIAEIRMRETELENKKEQLVKAKEQAVVFHGELKKLIEALEIATKAGIPLIDKEGNEYDAEKAIKAFSQIDPNSRSFSPQELIDLYSPLSPFFEKSINIAKFRDDIDIAKGKIAACTDLTDSALSKMLIGGLISEHDFSDDMDFEEQMQLASLILKDDVGKIQTNESYQSLAERGSSELLDTIADAQFRTKLIAFRYKLGDKTEQPFKGLKPVDFATVDAIKALFDRGAINDENGFFVYAAFRQLEGSSMSDQSKYLQKKLMEMIAEKLGVEKRMDESGISRIVSDAFDERLEGAEPHTEAYFGHYDKNEFDWKSRKIREIKMRLKILDEKLKLGNIEQPIYALEYRKLMEEAEAFDVEGEFSQNSIMRAFWNSKQSQWLKDRGYDLGSYLARKTKAAGFGALGVAGRGVWGTAKIGTGLAFQTAMTPLRLTKYPLMLAGKPFIGTLNFFRKNKWAPYSIRESAKTDKDRVMGYFKGQTTDTVSGAKETLKTVPAKHWNAEAYKGQKYADRTKVKQDSLKEQADTFAAANDDEMPLTLSDSPFADLEKYKKLITSLDKGIEDAAEAEVKDVA